MSRPPESSVRPRRFYKAVSVAPSGAGFGVLLDGRPVKSPGGAALVLPQAALARLIADEWAAQAEVIELAHMPATRLAFTGLDHIAAARAATVQEIADYAGADLLCYRANAPASLVAREAAAWDPILAWAGEALDVALTPVTGIVHQPQPAQSLDRVAALANALDDQALAGLAYATSLFGSAILALAVQRGRLTGEAAFDLARMDEIFQEGQWGVDAEAAERTEGRRIEAVMIGAWFEAVGQGRTEL